MPPADRVGLFDRDVFMKLACCDLWDEVLLATGVTRPVRLASCTVRETMKTVTRKFRGEAILPEVEGRLEAMVAQSQVLADDPGLRPTLVELQGEEGIDVGEALLFASLEAASDPTLLLTGDKRFVAALAKAFPGRFAAARTRILTFEACLLAVCQEYGVAHVVGRVTPARGCDGTLVLALGHGAEVDHGSFSAALRSYGALPPVAAPVLSSHC